jgi:Predicted glycosyltransferases
VTADATRQRRLAEAADAWERGRREIETGDLTAARLWLERVSRIAPQDPRPRYECALVIAALDAPDAGAALRASALECDHAPAWIALARHAARRNDPAGAAEALARLLSRHVIDPSPDFTDFLTRTAATAGYPGWIAMSATGIVMRGEEARFEADGRPVDRLPRDLGSVAFLRATIAGADMLGSPPRSRPDASSRRYRCRRRRRAGRVGGSAGSTRAAPDLHLIDRCGVTRMIRPRAVLEPVAASGFLPRHGFRLGAARLSGLAPPFRIVGPEDQIVAGTPIDPALHNRPAAAVRPRSRTVAMPGTRARLVAVMPVYRDEAATRIALESAVAAAPEMPIIVIDDASPDPALARWLRAEAVAGRIVLRRQRHNRGFPAAANAGFRLARRLVPGCDILLLNADIELPPGAPARLQAALYAGDDIASATPLSNEATILSYPDRSGGNPVPDRAALDRIDRLARRVNGSAVVTIPTAIGFCMAIRHDALRAVGGFDVALFAQGYAEENDWCRRAVALGFRNVAVPGVFVAHHGGVSFGAAGSALCARNLELLERRHPGYHALIEAHHAADPLRRARFRLDRARFRAEVGVGPSVILVSHDHGGGIARIVTARMSALRAAGVCPILIQPDFSDPGSRARGIGTARLTDRAASAYPNLCYRLPAQFASLIAVLRAANPDYVEFHHMLGHDPALLDLPAALGIPAEFVVHDYAHFCKRVNLIGPARRYCGEPDVAACASCLAEAGSELTDPIGPAGLVARSSAQLRAARRVSVPCEDTARRLRRHFPGISVTVTPWEDDRARVSLRNPPATGARLIAVVGGIGPAKGYDVLLDCARDAAARDLPLRFVLIGTSERDSTLIETGRVTITGAYAEGEAAMLIARSGAHLGFLPSIWPETWCFALGEMWRGGLYAAGFDLGAQAARIKATGRGFLLPLGLPAARINQTLLAWRPDLGNLNNRLQPPINDTFALANPNS